MMMLLDVVKKQSFIAAQKIIYDPVSWIHPQRFSVPYGFTTPRCRSILNDILLSHFGLSTLPLDAENERERYLIANWPLIAKAAMMATCQRYKANLFRYGLWGKLDGATKQFALIDLPNAKNVFPGPMTFDQLKIAAKQEIGLFASDVSAVMKSRLPLLFPGKYDDVDLIFMPEESNELVMRMAIQHAKRNE